MPDFGSSEKTKSSTNHDVTYEDILNCPYWRHRIPLRDGNHTPGMKGPEHWDALQLPTDLDGKSVLTLGSFDGLHAFEAERRGADRVLATDIWEAHEVDPRTDTNTWLDIRPGKTAFNLAHEYMDSDVNSRTIDVFDVSPSTIGSFDIVIASGLIYHLRDPLTAMENAVSVANEHVIIESAISHKFGEHPALEFAPNDPKCNMYPTLEAMKSMLSWLGCSITDAFYSDYNWSAGQFANTANHPVNIYSDFRLEDKVDSVSPNQPVQVLHKTDTSVRVHFGELGGQAWVAKRDVSHDLSGSMNLLARIGDKYQRDGLGGLARGVLRIMKNPRSQNGNRGVVHGRV